MKYKTLRIWILFSVTEATCTVLQCGKFTYLKKKNLRAHYYKAIDLQIRDR